MSSRVAKVKFASYEESVGKALDLIGAGKILADQKKIIFKPNLTNTSAFPVTTNVRAVQAALRYARDCNPRAAVIIAEGSGGCPTARAFKELGYSDLEKEYDARMVDFNKAEVVKLRDERALVWKEMFLPEVALEAFLISIPAMKDHSMAKTTLSMKNMFGLAPEKYYGGTWKKSKLHFPDVHKSVYDINLYRRPDIALIDGSVGVAGSHLDGSFTKFRTIIASFDPVAADASASEVLGHDWRDIRYLQLASGKLGTADDIELVQG